jgi:mono/diheme cytochrome c family protein
MEGNLVYASHCRSCHGTVGEGGTDYALERGLEVPSLVDPAPLRGNVRDSVLEIIYTGHVRGMPTWGVAGISPREIDAVTYYLLQVLRPEVLGGERGSGSD